MLYIFSDAPLVSDVNEVLELRKYLRTIDGFKDVIIIYQDQNLGIKNIEQAIEIPLKNHGSVIYLEEDLEVSDMFLKFMNDALSFYKNDEKVFSITGYCQSCLNDYDGKGVSASFFFTAWSCGLWSSKYYEYKSFFKELNPYLMMNSNFHLKIKFILKHGISQYLDYKIKCINKKLTPDLLIGFYIWYRNKIQIFPLNSLVITNGFDGSGMNCGIDNRFNQKYLNVLNKNIQFYKSFDEIEMEKNFYKVKELFGLNSYSALKAIIKYFIKYTCRL
jgi:hypothetical protein